MPGERPFGDVDDDADPAAPPRGATTCGSSASAGRTGLKGGFILKTAVGSDLRGGFVGVHNPCEQLTPAQGVAADRVGVPSGSV
jgi:hypothetical protein